MTPAGWNSVQTGVAQTLADAGIGTYRPDGSPYTPGESPGIYHGRMPPTPDAAITVTAYNQTVTRTDSSPDVYVQIRFRMPGPDPRQVNTTAEDAYRVLHDRAHVSWGDAHVLLCRRTITAPLGTDDNDRHERTDSYRLTLNP